jgi:hypothetical protein
VAVLTFVSVLGAALLGLFSKTRLPSEQHLRDDTSIVVRLVGNLFVVMTGLFLTLMLNSARNTLETNNRIIRTLATEVILLDRTMRALGPETEDARRDLVEYVQNALDQWHGNVLEQDPRQEARLEAAGTKLRAIRVSDEQKVELWHGAIELHRQVVRQRWVDESGGTIPAPLIIMLILWLAIIFAGFGFGAPRNTIVTASFFLAALLISAALYLIVDMDTPSTGMFEPIQVSNVPFQRAMAQLQR